MKTVIEMAQAVGYPLMTFDGKPYVSPELARLVELVRADEREMAYKRRGVFMFNPYSGTPRHPSDIQSDPHAILLLDPEQPIQARSNT